MQSSVNAPNWRRIWTVAAVILGIIVLLWFASRIPKTVSVFVIAAFIASGVHPIVHVLERNRMNRLLAIGLVYTLLILLIVISLVVVLPITFEQFQALAQNVPGYLSGVQHWIDGAELNLHARFPHLNLPRQFANIHDQSGQRITELLTALLASLGTLALNIATGAFIALSALILSVFFLLNGDQLASGFAGLFPPGKRDTARELATEAVGVFGGFIAGQVIVSAITGIAIALLTELFGFKFALLLGLISAVAYAIPLVGMLLAHVVALVIAAPQGVGMIVAVEVIMFIVARISDNVLVPKIMGGSVGVSPIAVMFAVFAGGELFGLPGLILGIPAAALLRLVWNYFVAPWLRGSVIEVAATTTPLPTPAEISPPIAKA
ncbi:MAG: AI-2E family transporter [Candidatus Eremiobacteraeota bacterium]|nr:AI-2E family transporter [Candidatus Eremiobacteraeota bacterium]